MSPECKTTNIAFWDIAVYTEEARLSFGRESQVTSATRNTEEQITKKNPLWSVVIQYFVFSKRFRAESFIKVEEVLLKPSGDGRYDKFEIPKWNSRNLFTRWDCHTALR